MPAIAPSARHRATRLPACHRHSNRVPLCECRRRRSPHHTCSRTTQAHLRGAAPIHSTARPRSRSYLSPLHFHACPATPCMLFYSLGVRLNPVTPLPILFRTPCSPLFTHACASIDSVQLTPAMLSRHANHVTLDCLNWGPRQGGPPAGRACTAAVGWRHGSGSPWPEP